jgi:hypothetical protein
LNTGLGVVNYISLAGVHMGQYGGSNPSNVANIYQVFYTPEAQATNSIASYWNDPFHKEMFLNISVFLPQLNNLNTVDPSKF